MSSRAGERSSLIRRQALLDRLTHQPAAVTLVSAPAGSGKTELLRSWIREAGIEERTAWVSVERDERDPETFWLALYDAVHRVADGRIRPFTPSPDHKAAHVVDQLMSELGELGLPVWLVIDDLHELGAGDAMMRLESLLSRRPPGLRFVLSTRHEPRLGLHRLRVAGDLFEVRDADMRFTRAETCELLTACGIDLSDAAIDSLHTRTEGWAAGLRLAALALAEHPEPERFVAEFSGSERTVAAFLLAEVLERQPEPVRRMLLRTSILDRVSGSLADALTGVRGSEAMLQRLEDANAFVSALDAGRTWFRYHHLLGDLLRLELRRTEPEVVPELHRAAAGWYQVTGDHLSAVRHLMAARDWHDAARILCENGISFALDGQLGALRTFLREFPRSSAGDPYLLTMRAADEIAFGSLDEAAAYLELAERHADQVLPERRSRFEVGYGLVRLGLARRQHNIASVAEQVERLLAPAAIKQASLVGLSTDVRAFAMLSMAAVDVWTGHGERAEQLLEQTLELARRTDRPFVEIKALEALALADTQRRSFTQARARSLEALAIAESRNWQGGWIVATSLAMIATVDVWQGRSREAGPALARAEAASQSSEFDPALEITLRLVRGCFLVGVGRLEEAIGAFHAALRQEARLGIRHPLSAAIRECLTLTQLRLGDVVAAHETMKEAPAAYLVCTELRTATAALHVADGDPQAAIDVLGPVFDGTVPGLRDNVNLVNAVLVNALAWDALGDARAVEAAIEQALDIAESDVLIWPFVMVAPTALLERHPRHRTAHASLLSDILGALAGARASRAPVTELADPLSAAELRVLRHLPGNLSAPEIGQELFVSTSTVKTHIRHIYAKLGVHRRSEAVERARSLGLLGSR